MEIRVMAGQIITIFIVIVLLLTVASLMGQYYKFFGGRDRYLVYLFDLNGEWNIPTIYAAFSLLICSLISGSIGVLRNKVADVFCRDWFVLAGLLFSMAVDELLQMHEQLNGPLRVMLNAKGAFYYAWVIPGIVVVIVLGLCLRRFILSLPRRTKRLMIASGVLYVSGVLGVEMMGAAYISNVGTKTFGYELIATFEEVLEMVGILVFMYSLFSYLSESVGEVRISFFTG